MRSSGRKSAERSAKGRAMCCHPFDPEHGDAV
jgi:hypothetical protein